MGVRIYGLRYTHAVYMNGHSSVSRIAVKHAHTHTHNVLKNLEVFYRYRFYSVNWDVPNVLF